MHQAGKCFRDEITWMTRRNSPDAKAARRIESSLHYMMAHLNERLGQYIAMVELHRVTDPATRLARSIGVLFNPVLYPRMGPLLPVSQEELGELAGLTRQRTNAAIRTLEAAGLVRAEYRSLRILDLKGLLNVDEA